ncbi:hypothetical protein [Rhodomicrobium sp. R_RK_3]|uniref:hypothetical protein n=1 Tax=Rhodomicrobium sp. R_RK_3 TaxID=2029567 RepID=UPI000B4BCD63|nr:hypothetical protein [Rhodomicrobium sp. R_RK_3]
MSYPPDDEAWNSTHYDALAQRIETGGLALPTLSGAGTKLVFERMVSIDNIPLRVGLNKEIAITLRFQKLEPVLQPLHRLVTLYSNETHKGKPYATELARLMVYETKAAGTLLDISEPYLANLQKDKRYQYHVDNMKQIKSDARQIYIGLVQSMAETKLYSKSDMLKIIGGALAELPSYHPIFAEQDRADLNQRLAQQIAKTTDQELKTALTELRDAIEHRRIPT